LPLLVLALGWVYPLAQIKLALGALLLWLAKLAQGWWATRRIDRRQFGALVVLTVSLAAVVYFHPEFAFFRKAAQINGATHQAIGLVTIAAVATALFAAGTALFILGVTRKLGLAAPFFLATAGLATVVIYAGQALLYFGFGAASEYAVRKHAYGLTTLLGASLIALLAEAAERAVPRLFARALPSRIGGGPAAMIAAFLAVFILISHYAEDRGLFLAYEQDLRAALALQGQTISLNRNFPSEFNFAASIGDLHLPGELMAFAVVTLRGGKLDSPVSKLPRYAIMSHTESVPPHCVSAAATLATAIVVDYGCK
jgi:hypothetical protein